MTYEKPFISRKEIRATVWEKCQGRCSYCGVLLNPFDRGFAIDHITPLSVGGQDELDNLMGVCLNCNSRKGNKNLEEFRDHCAKTEGKRFTDKQIEYLKSLGVEIKKPEFLFYFERVDN